LSIKQRTIDGVKWSFGIEILIQIVRLGLGILIARELGPDPFGLFTMSILLLGFGVVVLDFGLPSALIQRKEVDEKIYSSAFWMSCGMGVGLFLLFYALSGGIAALYNEPELLMISRVTSLTFLLIPLGIIHEARLRKMMRFKELSVIDFWSFSISSVIGLLMAYQGWGIWSIVIQHLVYLFLKSFGAIWVSKWQPKWHFDWDDIITFKRFSTYLMGHTWLQHLLRNADDFLVGKNMGKFDAGIYNKAYNFMHFPLRKITNIVRRVLFSSFSTMQHEPDKIKAAYLQVNRGLAFLIFPLMVGIYVIADIFVLLLFGEGWVAMIPLIKILSIAGAIQAVVGLNNEIFTSLGKTDLQFKYGLGFKAFILIGFVIGMQWGILGVAIAYLITTYLVSIPDTIIMGRLIDLSIGRVYQNLLSTLVCALGMGMSVYGFRIYFELNEPTLINLLMCSICGLVSYICCVALFKIKPFTEILQLIKER